LLIGLENASQQFVRSFAAQPNQRISLAFLYAL
jgi:hypothetical protein